MVALENLLALGGVKVGFVKRMVWGMFRFWAGTAAEGRVMDTGITVGGAVKVWRCDMVRPVGLMGTSSCGLDRVALQQSVEDDESANIRTGCTIATLCFLRSCRIFANSEAFISTI